MEGGLEAHRSRFADIRTGLVREVDLGMGLIDVGSVYVRF